ncbi:MAG: hypothetical protein FVQ79_05380, partial [Planctomycetes bacterium]|nr:hypothetical protein [Planctomycetota bacterium]
NGLPAGQYSGQITIADPQSINSPKVVDVSLTIVGPSLGISQNNYSFTASKQTIDPSSQTLTISNPGGGTLAWTITPDCDWMTITPASGAVTTGTADVMLDIDQSKIDYGNHTCQLTVSAPNADNSPQTVTVTLDVLPPELSLNQNSFSFSVGGLTTPPDVQTLTIENTGYDTLNWTITESTPCDWLTVTPQTDQTTNVTPTEVTISVDPAVAGYGLHTCQLTVSDPNANNSPQTVDVTFNVWQPVIYLSFIGGAYMPGAIDMVDEVELHITGFDDPIIVNGTYDLAVPYGWSGTIIPSKPGRVFLPDDMTFNNVTDQQTTARFDVTYTYSGGNGSEIDPFQISDANDLRNMADDPLNWDKHFIVTNNIDMGDPNTPNMNTITPFGDFPFSGTFDGQGFSIIDMNISSQDHYAALFGDVGKSYFEPDAEPTIKNLTLINPTIINHNDTDTGCLAGYVGSATIENCIVEGGHVTGVFASGLVGKNYGTIRNCHAIDVYVEGYYAGGLVERNNGIITDCSASGTVIGYYCVGGLVGASGRKDRPVSIIQNCWSSCSVVCTSLHEYYPAGGLIGDNESIVIDCYATGDVSGNHQVGGLIGRSASYDDIIVENCFATGDVSGVDEVGGLIGANYSDISQCYSTGDVTGNSQIGGLIGANFSHISRCYSTGAVTGLYDVGGVLGTTDAHAVAFCYTHSNVTGENNVGGFLGSSGGGASFYDCYTSGYATGNIYVGAFTGIGHNWLSYQKCFWNIDNNPTLPGIGSRTDPNVIGETTAAMKTRSTYTGWIFPTEIPSSAGDIWDICEGTNYPRLVWQIPAGDYVCPDGVSAEDLLFFAKYWLRDDCGMYLPEDISGDGLVGVEDIIDLAEYWYTFDCGDCDGRDVSGDGNVDLADLSYISQRWNMSEYGNCNGAELTGDGKIDLQDFAVFAENWLSGAE